MLNELRAFNRKYHLIQPGDPITCAVSGGADSMALLWALYLLKEEWNLHLSAAHFNHQLRGAESDRDAQFVADFCKDYGIPLYMGSEPVKAGKKGLEAAARMSRYAFFRTIPGKIATAHTADDNAETILLHLIRGTGLKGLGGITPQYGHVIRPMLSITRQQVEAFLEEYAIPHITDSSNETDDFLRNRLRHHVMPLLADENPKIAENMSAMALRLRQDEETLQDLANQVDNPPRVSQLRQLPPAILSRVLEQFLKQCGVKEPEAVQIQKAEALVFSNNPSAKAQFPNGITIGRNYDRLEVVRQAEIPCEITIAPGQQVTFGAYRITCTPAEAMVNNETTFTISPVGEIRIRSRQSGDELRLHGGNKSVKKRFIDKKIPANRRPMIPVFYDHQGILAVGELGTQTDRQAKQLPAVTMTIVSTSEN